MSTKKRADHAVTGFCATSFGSSNSCSNPLHGNNPERCPVYECAERGWPQKIRGGCRTSSEMNVDGSYGNRYAQVSGITNLFLFSPSSTFCPHHDGTCKQCSDECYYIVKHQTLPLYLWPCYFPYTKPKPLCSTTNSKLGECQQEALCPPQ